VLVKFEVRIFNHGEAIGVYPPKFTGHVTLAQPLLEKIFRVFFGLSLGTCIYNICTSIYKTAPYANEMTMKHHSSNKSIAPTKWAWSLYMQSTCRQWEISRVA